MEAIENKKDDECQCLRAHGYKKNTVLISSPQMTDFMPRGTKALFLSRDEELKKSLAKDYFLYPLDKLLCGETESFDNNSDKSPDESLEFDCGVLCRDFENILKKITLPEDIRFVISDGDFNALGKFIAQQIERRGAGVRHLAAGAGNLSEFDYVLEGLTDGFCLSEGQAAAYRLKRFSGGTGAIAKDSESIAPHTGFAFVLNLYLALFDWDISALLFGGEVCSHCFIEVQKIVHGLLDAVKSLPKRSLRLKSEIFAACVNASALIDTGGDSLLQSGAIQSAGALQLLFKHEKRPLIDLFEAGFLLAPTVARVYAAFLESLPFSFPPDNSLHCMRLTEYLGLPELKSIKMPPAYLDKAAVRLSDYRLGVYQSRLIKHIYDVIRVLDEAYPMYLRLFSDDGFWLKDFLSPPDVSLSLGLGADVVHSNSLLYYMRSKGLLDRYLV